MIRDTQSAQILKKQDGRNIYAIMKTMCPPSYDYIYMCIYEKKEKKMIAHTSDLLYNKICVVEK